jgi:DNA-binding PadR family transcriptional regulator
MNTLGYAILSALGRKPCSGYDLTQYLEVIWPAKHSQIYPTLSKMEQKEFLTHECVEQIGKPNKKIFSITEKGEEALKNWLTRSPADPVNRDEFLIKVYSIWLLEGKNSIKLIRERMSRLEETMVNLSNKIADMEQKKESDTISKNFGRYILYNRKFSLVKEEKTWCKWVIEVIEK